MNAKDWIQQLDLTPHVEGGYYRQVVKSKDLTKNSQGEDRAQYTSIYFLLEKDNPSNFHRLTSDEIWYYHHGEELTIHTIDPQGNYETIRLGPDVSSGAVLQAVVPKGVIFGSSVESGFAVVSCAVAPGFEYEDFELFSREELFGDYPEHAAIIERLTRE